MPTVLGDLLGDVLARHVAERPHAQALRFEGLALSYAGLARAAHDLAATLHARGVKAGDRVAWLGANHPAQIALLFALARLGAMLVPLNFRLAGAEWDGVLRDCAPGLLFHDDAWRDAAQALAARHGIAAHAAQWPMAEPARASASASGAATTPSAEPPGTPDAAAPDAPALLVYTSGTTGLPKGAVHTQANLLANMHAAAHAQSLVPGDVVATVLPLFHVGGLCIQTLPALAAGACVILHARFEPGALLDCIARERPTLTLLVPAVMKALVDHPDWPAADLSSLRAVWAGSSTLPRALVDAFHARRIPVCNVYGATETGPFSIALGPAQAMSHADSCGWPAQGVQAMLADVKDGVGEILVRGPNVAARYWPDRPALDAQGWFHTGDLGRQAADGSYTVVGRAKDMIISGGENIYPAEIENLLAAHPLVAECAVIGLPDAQWGEVAVAAIVPREPAALDDAQRQQQDAQITEFLRERLARYKLPRRFVRLGALPRTALGKVQKPALTALVAVEPSGSPSAHAPAPPAPPESAPAPPAAPSR